MGEPVTDEARRSSAVAKWAGIALLISAAAALTGCPLFGYVNGPERYVLWGSELVLAWDPPAGVGPGTRIVGYTLFYRDYPNVYGSTWKELGTSTRSPRVFRVDGASLPPGQYEFAIRSVDEYGNYSDMHTSTDSHADPPTGWYLQWLGGTP